MVVVTELVGGCHTQSWVAGIRLNIAIDSGGGKDQHCTDGGDGRLN